MKENKKETKFGKAAALGLAAGCCAILIAANAHFVYVASATQPGCVDHIKAGAVQDGKFSAAKSSC